MQESLVDAPFRDCSLRARQSSETGQITSSAKEWHRILLLACVYPSSVLAKITAEQVAGSALVVIVFLEASNCDDCEMVEQLGKQYS